ncbi:contactin-associated protein 1, partial [Lasius niger]
MQIRTYDQKWHLTPDDKNAIDLRLGNGYKAHYDLKDLDKRGFYTDVSFDQMSALLKALETVRKGQNMLLSKKILPALFLSTGFLLAGHQVFAKPSPTVQDENTPTNLGAGMYLMKTGGMWGSVMHLNEPQAHHPGEPAAKAPAKPAQPAQANTDSKTPKKPDLCVASDQNQTLILRASANGLEVRSVGKEWSLQKDILTSVQIAVGKDYKANLTMQALSKDQIGVPVNLEQMVRLVDALSNNNQAIITYA